MSDTLFPEIPASPAPALARLRAEYAEALAAWREADAHEDESGEAVPWDVIQRLARSERQLREEEARQARQ